MHRSDSSDELNEVPPDRDARRTISARFAADAIGPLQPGCEVFGLTMSKFSLTETAVNDPRYFGDGPHDVDLRRIGITRRS
jgi:hypothetical protein